jgi:MFS family permease
VTDLVPANGVFFGFAFFGTLAAGLIMNWQGRIRAFQFSACWHIVGAAICAGTVDQAMFLVGRSVTGVGTGMSLVIGPIYFAEVAPPLSRGIMAGMHGAALNNGYMLAAWVGCPQPPPSVPRPRSNTGASSRWALAPRLRPRQARSASASLSPSRS